MGIVLSNYYLDPKYVQEVKAELPRRASERPNHKLFPHYDILIQMQSTIFCLSCTFLTSEYGVQKLCCFIPGKVIDEIFSVLRTIKVEEKPESYKILKELRDISSMAREYFKDRIVPTLKVQRSQQQLTSPYQMIAQLKKTVISQNRKIVEMDNGHKKQVEAYKKEVIDQNKKISLLKKDYKDTVARQNKKIVEMEGKLAEMVEMVDKVVAGKGSSKRSRERESPAELEMKTTGRYHLRKRKRDAKSE